jgi:hypothetical protein
MKYFYLIGCLIFAVGGAQAQDATARRGPIAPAGANAMSGKVVETLNAGDYTYIQVDTGKTRNWAAAPRFAVKPGDTVSISASMPMPKYHSKTLARDFDVVYFTDRVSVNGAAVSGSDGRQALPKDHPPVGSAETPLLPKDHPPIGTAPAAGTPPSLPQGHPPIATAPAQVNLDLSGIQRAAGGKTVEEIYSEKSKLSGKEVRVRGKVVKYNAMILGKNWIHLRDGTGKEGSNDLLVTSSSMAKVGDTIVATGVVSVNKDFGASYKYPVMLEDARIAAE